jgi:hypothetical protein
LAEDIEELKIFLGRERKDRMEKNDGEKDYCETQSSELFNST